MNTRDLSLHHKPIGDLLRSANAELARFSLTKEQLAFFHEHGYLSGIRIVDDRQVETLREELAQLTDPAHEGNELFYEYHSNESGNPDGALSRFGCLANHSRIPRSAVEPGIHGACVAVAGRRCALLA